MKPPTRKLALLSCLLLVLTSCGGNSPGDSSTWNQATWNITTWK